MVSVLYHAHPCMKCSLDVSNFLEEISSFSHSSVLLSFLALFIEKGLLISPCYSLELSIPLGVSFPFSFACHFSSFFGYCKASSDNHFASLHFFFFGIVLVTVSCTMLPTSVHSSSGTPSTRSIRHLHCIIIRDLIQVIPEWSTDFPGFL